MSILRQYRRGTTVDQLRRTGTDIIDRDRDPNVFFSVDSTAIYLRERSQHNCKDVTHNRV